MTKPQKYTWQRWLRDCAKDNACPAQSVAKLTGMITGQDARALDAVAACWELYSCSDDAGARGALQAVTALLPAMQSKCHIFAREIIAWAMNWSDRERLWALVAPADDSLPPVRMPEVR